MMKSTRVAIGGYEAAIEAAPLDATPNQRVQPVAAKQVQQLVRQGEPDPPRNEP